MIPCYVATILPVVSNISLHCVIHPMYQWFSARLQYLQWRYCSLALNHRYHSSNRAMRIQRCSKYLWGWQSCFKINSPRKITNVVLQQHHNQNRWKFDLVKHDIPASQHTLSNSHEDGISEINITLGTLIGRIALSLAQRDIFYWHNAGFPPAAVILHFIIYHKDHHCDLIPSRWQWTS